MQNKKYYFLNLGCPKNQTDGDHIRGTLQKLGFAEFDQPDDVDYIIVNTCAFIKQAREETRGEISELLPFKKNSTRLIAIGCYPVLYNIKKDINEIDAAFGLNQVDDLLRYLTGSENLCYNPAEFNRAIETGDTSYAYVKISDGCDNRCSYCTIPLIRGPYRSIPPEEILKEVEYLASKSVREIVLVAQDSAIYGNDFKTGVDLACLCRMISRVDRIEWIRIMYAHPAHLDERLINKLFEIDKVCRYLDIPVQHISSNVLKMMNRPGGSQKINQAIKCLRNVDKNISLRTTLMVGFPGETDDDFKELLDFVESTEFDYLGIFCYSPEENTVAKKLERTVERKLAMERQELLYSVAEDISINRTKMQIGEKQELLVDAVSAEDPKCLEARSYRQAPEIDRYYKIPLLSGLCPGMFVEAVITDVDTATVEDKAYSQFQ